MRGFRGAAEELNSLPRLRPEPRCSESHQRTSCWWPSRRPVLDRVTLLGSASATAHPPPNTLTPEPARPAARSGS